MSDILRVYDEVGKDGYPPEWHKTIKHHVRRRAWYRCVRCHHPYRNGERGPKGEWSACDAQCDHGGPFRLRMPGDEIWEPYDGGGEAATLLLNPAFEVEARWRILTVHHLDGDKANCRWWNIAALCQRCHLKIQGRVQLHRVYPWEHSDWFKPYAAGWYAHAYLGEDLSCAAVEERLEELLALERVV